MSWFSVVGSGVALGCLIDFWIGPSGQKRLKDRMETWWFKLSDMRWHDLGREEALFAVNVMDRLFGRRLFSAQRLIVVVSCTCLFSGLIITLIFLGHVATFPWRAFFPLSFARSFWLCFYYVRFCYFVFHYTGGCERCCKYSSQGAVPELGRPSNSHGVSIYFILLLGIAC